LEKGKGKKEKNTLWFGSSFKLPGTGAPQRGQHTTCLSTSGGEGQLWFEASLWSLLKETISQRIWKRQVNKNKIKWNE